MDHKHDYLAILRRSWRTVLVSAVLTCLVAIAASVALPKTYVSEARILVSEPESSVEVFGSALPQLTAQKDNPVQTQAELLRSPSLYAAVIQQLGLSVTPATLARRVKISPIDQTSVISIVVEAGDGATAASVANALADEYLDRIRELKKASLESAAAAVEAALANAKADLQAIDARAAKRGLSASQATERQGASDRVNSLSDKLEQLGVNVQVEQASGTVVDRASASSAPVGPSPLAAGLFGFVAGGLAAGAVVLFVGTRAESTDLASQAEAVASVAPSAASGAPADTTHTRANHWRSAGDRRSRPREDSRGDRRGGPVDRRVARLKAGALDLRPDDVAEIEGVWRQVLESQANRPGGAPPGGSAGRSKEERDR